MRHECRDKLLKIVPMLISENDSELLATVYAIKRVLEAYQLTMHDLANSITATGPKPQPQSKSKPQPKPATKPKPWTDHPPTPPVSEILRVCELFNNIRAAEEAEVNFMTHIYIDANMMRDNYFMSVLEIARFEEIRGKYKI